MRDKTTSARLCAKNAGGLMHEGRGGGGAYLRDTTVTKQAHSNILPRLSCV